ncbi:unnamed protein product, partial [Nesidiocoris tenuis]
MRAFRTHVNHPIHYHVSSLGNPNANSSRVEFKRLSSQRTFRLLDDPRLHNK